MTFVVGDRILQIMIEATVMSCFEERIVKVVVPDDEDFVPLNHHDDDFDKEEEQQILTHQTVGKNKIRWILLRKRKKKIKDDDDQRPQQLSFISFLQGVWRNFCPSSIFREQEEDRLVCLLLGTSRDSFRTEKWSKQFVSTTFDMILTVGVASQGISPIYIHISVETIYVCNSK